jgi:hypothetical protein
LKEIPTKVICKLKEEAAVEKRKISNNIQKRNNAHG